ncbi:HSP90 family protein [Catelliglobosispora koreensis]|uniref:HSP90 family protein n=1 Tax=Catelliglobosispora koreensis TaxID=129052 RepID=UPI00038217DF|nr:HSP90 family protein [Catelliglobosispora koreensis]
MGHSFQVDLRGVVDLLSHHLYASPRVYLRELLQNAVDAITARQSVEPTAPALVRIECGGNLLRISDTGIGLTEEQVHELLATIGRSGKRDELGFARHEFLGQFGIGLLSCFLVADEIQVVTKAAEAPTVYWTGFSDGRYEVSAGPERHEPGTTVTVKPRPGAQDWLAPQRVTELARLFGSLLPVTVEVGTNTVTGRPLPWQEGGERVQFCQEVFGFTPYDVIELDVPEAGLKGLAYVLPTPASPAAKAGHRVYLKRMLLAEGAEGLLPDWAFFVRCVIDASELRPTASREALYEDGLLEQTRERLGDQLRGWLVGLSQRAPARVTEFLAIHHLGVKALALHDDEMLRLVDRWWPMETNLGRLTLEEFRNRYGVIRYCSTLDEFRQLSAVAAAQQLAVVNAGYTYDAELIERLGMADSSILVDRLDPSDLTTRFHHLSPGEQAAFDPLRSQAQRVLDRLGCEAVVRGFDPVTLPALYLVDRDATFSQHLRQTQDEVDDDWAGVLAAIAQTAAQARPQLVINYRNALVRRIASLSDSSLIELAIESLYAQSLLLGHHPMRPADTALLNRSFLGLLDRAVTGEEP